jgi:hypothetical protein
MQAISITAETEVSQVRFYPQMNHIAYNVKLSYRGNVQKKIVKYLGFHQTA